MARPNIIYLNSHDTGRYIQPYGYAVNTPHMQKLAEQGVTFRQCFTSNPTCSPSRACLATSQYAHTNGMIGLSHRGSNLHDYTHHMSHLFHNNGYTTALAGFQHVARPDEMDELLAYDHRLLDELEPKGMTDKHGVAADVAVQFIESQAKTDSDKPFYLEIGFGRTHRTGRWHNHDESPLGDGRWARPPAPLPDTPQTREDFADFAVCAERLDSYYGLIFDALENAGLDDNTIVICTTDHGIAYPFMKCNLTDHGIGVLLIMRGPGGLSGGRVIDAMVNQIDILPTVCDIAGIEKPDYFQGVSMKPVIDGEADKLHEAIFASVNYHASYEPKRAVRTERFKYIRRFDVHDHPVLANCDASPSKDQMFDLDWPHRPQEAEYLFDLAFDPNEGGNVAKDPAYQQVLEDMRKRLYDWMKATDDPLLSGKVEPWPGLKVNPVDSTNPGDPPVPAK